MTLNRYDEYLYGKLKWHRSICIIVTAAVFISLPFAIYAVILYFSKYATLAQALPYILLIGVALLLSFTLLTLGSVIKATLVLSGEVRQLREDLLDLALKK